ncbi:MAG: hypothetical protein VKO39_04590 [Cyanobacteriota bacterium]|nr:hypothetical protein [Cyanobacteriota bacterium]
MHFDNKEPLNPALYDRSTAPARLREALNQLEQNEGLSQRAWEVFQFIRKETHQEHVLLMGRVTWYITCQSFLLTIYAVTSLHSCEWNAFSNLRLPSLAILLSVLAMLMILVTTSSIKSWGNQRDQIVKAYPQFSPLLLERWRHHRQSKDWIHSVSLLFPKLIPVLFITAWLIIAFFPQALWLPVWSKC